MGIIATREYRKITVHPKLVGAYVVGIQQFKGKIISKLTKDKKIKNSEIVIKFSLTAKNLLKLEEFYKSRDIKGLEICKK